MILLADESDAPRACLIGCGRKFRRDDQAGILIAEWLAGEAGGPPRYTRICATEAPCASQFTEIDGLDVLVLVDAARPAPGQPAGLVAEIDYLASPECIGRRGGTNTHSLSVDTALRLGRELDLLPPKVWVYAVSGEDFGYGADVSLGVAESIPRIAARIRARIDREIGDAVHLNSRV